MTTHTATNVEATAKMTLAELTKLVFELQARIEKLEQPKTTSSSGKEMTDDDARRILTGDLSTVKHKEAAEKLGLTYGQVYSCRGEFTFKHIHKEMRDSGKANPWKK